MCQFPHFVHLTSTFVDVKLLFSAPFLGKRCPILVNMPVKVLSRPCHLSVKVLSGGNWTREWNGDSQPPSSAILYSIYSICYPQYSKPVQLSQLNPSTQLVVWYLPWLDYFWTS